MPRSFLLLGASLALGMPVGLAIVEALAAGEVPTPASALEDIATFPITYIYLALSTIVVCVVLGTVLGRQIDDARRLAALYQEKSAGPVQVAVTGPEPAAERDRPLTAKTKSSRGGGAAPSVPGEGAPPATSLTMRRRT